MPEPTLGEDLRRLREEKGLSLRQGAAKAEVNAGYLSQLERDEIEQPSPAILQKLAAAYDEPFILLMRRAGYVEDDPEGLSPNQQRALKVMGDLHDDELKAVRAVLDAIRSSRSATFAFGRLDAPIAGDDRRLIRAHALAVLRRADVLGAIPTPLDRVMEVSELIAAGAIELEPELKRSLRARFGDLVDRTLDRVLGAIRFDSRELYVKSDLYLPRRRFVEAHEIAHEILPWHKDLYAFLDDRARLLASVHDLYERQANQGAIELLAQGDRMRREADDSLISVDGIDTLSNRFAISRQAGARYIVEESRQQVALAVSYRGSLTGKLMPAHLYASASFEQRFRWMATRRAHSMIEDLLAGAARGTALEPLSETDMRGQERTLGVEGFQTPQAVFVLFRASVDKARRLARVAAGT